MPVLKTEVPRFERGETAEQKLDAVVNYLNQLHEVLNFELQQLVNERKIVKVLDGYVTISDLKDEGKTVINGRNITTGEILAEFLRLYGAMTVYTDETLRTAGGTLGYMAGEHGFGDGSTEPTNGMAIMSEDGNHYLIVTDAGVRMTEHRNGSTYRVYLAGGQFRTDAILRATNGAQIGENAWLNAHLVNGQYVYGGTTHVNDLEIHGKTKGAMKLLWENLAPAAAFPADRTVPIEGLADYDLFLVQYRYSTEADEKWSGIFYAEPLTSTRCYVNAYYRNSEHAYRGIALFYGGEEAVNFGYANHNGEGDTAYLIPQRIYGMTV